MAPTQPAQGGEEDGVAGSSLGAQTPGHTPVRPAPWHLGLQQGHTLEPGEGGMASTEYHGVGKGYPLKCSSLEDSMVSRFSRVRLCATP